MKAQLSASSRVFDQHKVLPNDVRRPQRIRIGQADRFRVGISWLAGQ
jgi:hypothetical protein